VSLAKRNSLTLRLTLLFASASTIVLLALGYLIANSVEKHFEEQDVELLVGKLEHAKQVLVQASTPTDLNKLSQQLHDSSAGHQDLAAVAIGADGEILFASNTVKFPQALLNRNASNPNKPGRPTSWEQGDKSYRGISAIVPASIQQWSPALVAVAMETTHHQHFMAGFRITLWCFVGIAALLMGLLGWVAARRGLAPLDNMKKSLAEVSASSLDQRLPADQLPAELADLGNTLNGMLSRLEDSFSRLSGFSSDIAHELRTPVSNLMTQTQVALSKARTADEYHEILASNAEELERMARMISDMLFLAQADNGLILLSVEPVDLTREFQQLAEFYEPLLDEKSIKFSLVGDVVIMGDRLMLRRAFSNLLSNAIRHTPAGSEIFVGINYSMESHVEIEVRNPGVISKEHLPHLFERFYRADPSRHSDGESTGLGLAITKSIIEAHHASIEAASGGDMVRFKISFLK